MKIQKIQYFFLPVLLILVNIACKTDAPLSPEASRKLIQLPNGFKATVFAAEPDIVNPSAMAWDEKGRLWVLQAEDAFSSFDHQLGKSKITICEDIDGDGKSDKFQDFADGLHLSSGILIVDGGVIITQANNLLFLQDTNGDDKMDVSNILYQDFYDSASLPNITSLHYGMDNSIWGLVNNVGFNNHLESNSTHAKTVYRFSKNVNWTVDKLSFQQATIQFGYSIVSNTRLNTTHNYPEAYQNKLFTNLPLDHLVGIKHIKSDGVGYRAIEEGPFFYSKDPYTTPQCAEIGPDGNLWVADGYHPVELPMAGQNKEVNKMAKVAEKNSEASTKAEKKEYGRIFILKYKEELTSTINSLDRNNSRALLAALDSKNMFWRMTAQRLIVENKSANLIPELMRIVRKGRIGCAHALWILEALGAMEKEDDYLNEIIEKSLNSISNVIKRAAINAIPKTEDGVHMLLHSNLLTFKDLNIRLAAISKANELPKTEALLRKMKAISSIEINKEHEILEKAIGTFFDSFSSEKDLGMVK